MIFACLHNMPSAADMQIRYSPIKFLASRLCFYPDKLNKMEGYLFISFKLPSTFSPLNSYGNSQYSFAFSNPVQISVWRFLWSTLLSLTRICEYDRMRKEIFTWDLEISLYFLLQLFHSDTYQREEKTTKFSARERGGKDEKSSSLELCKFLQTWMWNGDDDNDGKSRLTHSPLPRLQRVQRKFAYVKMNVLAYVCGWSFEVLFARLPLSIDTDVAHI